MKRTTLDDKSNEPTPAVEGGWGWLWNASKAHYFGKDRRSLCGKWAFFGELQSDCEWSGACKACWNKKHGLKIKRGGA